MNSMKRCFQNLDMFVVVTEILIKAIPNVASRGHQRRPSESRWSTHFACVFLVRIHVHSRLASTSTLHRETNRDFDARGSESIDNGELWSESVMHTT